MAQRVWRSEGETLFRKVASNREEVLNEEPVILKAQGRLIPKWKMRMPNDEDTGEEIPTSAGNPAVSPVESDEPIVDLELIPYGSTRLRIAEFPMVE